MFSSFFLSKNQKLVQKWKSEHEQIVELATKVITSYNDGKVNIAKDALVDLRLVTLNHLMAEDMEFVELLKDDGVFISESHYLMSLIETLQYDTVYHEHLRYYSVQSHVL